MWCFSNFPGDDDERIFTVQHQCYFDMIGTIVNASVKQYLHAELILRHYGAMSIQVRQVESFDHRTVQDVHDLIAAWYRFKRRTERLFPLESDLSEDWRRFFWRETEELCFSSDFVTGVLDSTIHANTERGYAGEKRAKQVQRVRYQEMLRYTLPRPQIEADQCEV